MTNWESGVRKGEFIMSPIFLIWCPVSCESIWQDKEFFIKKESSLAFVSSFVEKWGKNDTFNLNILCLQGL